MKMFLVSPSFWPWRPESYMLFCTLWPKRTIQVDYSKLAEVFTEWNPSLADKPLFVPRWHP